jgi:hypothetical protein
MTDIDTEPATNGDIGKARDDRMKPSGSGERPKSRNGDNGHQDRSSPSSAHRNSPSPADAFRHASDMSATANSGTMNGNNRPPSTTSVHSNNSGGTRTTATSRRGGRTRSRSPPLMSNRNSVTTHDSRGFPPMNESDSNPSSAAAAAAAAAKALTKKPGGQPWPDRGPFREDRHRGGSPVDGGEPTKFPRYDNHFQGSRSWPAEDHDRRSGSYGHPQSIHRLPGGSGGSNGDPYGRHSGPHGVSYGSEHQYRNGGRSGGMHPAYDELGEDRRYSDRHHAGPRGQYEPEMRKNGRSMSPAPSERYGQPYYRGGSSSGMAPSDGRASPKGGPSRSGGGMSRVIGTATPIHVPRASEPPPSRHSRSGTPASVFRGRPGSEGPSSRREGRTASEDDTPQKILLSLRTPSTSFEEKQPSSKNRKDDTDLPPPSPDEPPQIQHSHHQHPSDFFEVRKRIPWCGLFHSMAAELSLPTLYPLVVRALSSSLHAAPNQVPLRWLLPSTCLTSLSIALGIHSMSWVG